MSNNDPPPARNDAGEKQVSRRQLLGGGISIAAASALGAAGAPVPQDRPIDGVDETDFLFGKSDKSNREGFPVFVADRLEAVKWRNWKVVFYEEQRDWWTPPTKLGSPKAFDLVTDPKEEYPATGLRSSWIAGPAMKIVVEFEKSLKKYPPILPGTPDPYRPPSP